MKSWLSPSEVMAVAIVKYLLRKSEVKCARTLAEQTSLRSYFTAKLLHSAQYCFTRR